MKAAFLIRCSTKNQDLDRQTNDLVRLSKALGYEYDLEGLVYGEKITGKDDVTKRNRESIDRLLADANKHIFDVVLVSEVSRMSRDPLSGRYYIRTLTNWEVPVYFKDIDIWTINPETGKKTKDAESIIGAAFDAAWKYLKSMKTQIASARRNQLDNNCISVGKPYFGYKRFGGKDKSKKTQWVVDDIAAEVVRAIYEEYLKDGATLKTTALAITQKYGESLKMRFSIGSIEHILQFKSYCTGEKSIMLTDPDREIKEEYIVKIPVIIDKEIWEAAERKRKAKAPKEVYPKQKLYLLSKLIKCPCCGYTMTPRIKSNEAGTCANGCYRIINGKKAMSWMCMSGVNKLTECKNRNSIANEKLEPIIWELIKKELINYANLKDDERLAKLEELQDKINSKKYQIEMIDKELEKLQKKKSVAYKIAVNASMENEALEKEAMEQYNLTVSEIRKEEENFRGINTQAIEEIGTLANLISFYSQPNVTSDLIEKAESDESQKRELVKELIKEIVPYKITTFRKKRREKGKESRKAYNDKDIITVKNGAVLLELSTINGTYYVFYNSNGREAVRYAYYMSGVYANFQNGVKKFEAYEAGEYFVISNANMVMETGDIDELVSINQFVEIAKANDWVLSYQYIPEK